MIKHDADFTPYTHIELIAEIKRLNSLNQELLRACKLAIDYLQKEGFHDGDAYPALTKAIAKAEGGCS